MDTTSLIAQLIAGRGRPADRAQDAADRPPRPPRRPTARSTPRFAAVRAAAEAARSPTPGRRPRPTSSVDRGRRQRRAPAPPTGCAHLHRRQPRRDARRAQHRADWTPRPAPTAPDARLGDRGPRRPTAPPRHRSTIGGTATLADAVDGHQRQRRSGVTAAVVQIGRRRVPPAGRPRTTTGADGDVHRSPAPAPSTSTPPGAGRRAHGRRRRRPRYDGRPPPTNTFADLLPGATVTVSKADATGVTRDRGRATPTPSPPRCRPSSTRSTPR